MSKLLFFALVVCCNFSSINLNFYKGSPIVADCLRQDFPDQLREDGTGAQTTARSTARTKVFMPIIWCTGGWNSSRIPWYMLLAPIGPTKPLLSVDGCQIIFVGGEDKNEGHFISPWCWHHSLSLFLCFLHIKMLIYCRWIYYYYHLFICFFVSFLYLLYLL